MMARFNDTFRFLSTPSARRATLRHRGKAAFCGISIHALREEGDSPGSAQRSSPFDFYPRPPRGGRHAQPEHQPQRLHISIHALREEGDPMQTARLR